MAIEQNRNRIVARITQSIKQSGVNLSAIPAGEQQRLVNTIADGLLLELDAMLDEISVPQPPSREIEPSHPIQALADAHQEQVLWEGRPFLALNESYVITTDRIRVFHGLLSKQVENLELVRLQDVDYSQGISERLFNIGDITLRSVDPSNPVLVLNNVKDPDAVQNIIRQAWLDARKRYGVAFRDQV